MPVYEYECHKCHKVSEALQKISDPPLKKCPLCGGKVEKIMSLGAFHLKGQGWYVTDYKGKNSSNAKNGGDGGDGQGAPKETKPKKDQKAEKKKKKSAKATNG